MQDNIRLDRRLSLSLCRPFSPLWSYILALLSFPPFFQANDNQVPDISDLEKELGKENCPKLETVYLEGNPLQKAEGSAYRRKVKLALPQLSQIDATFVR